MTDRHRTPSYPLRLPQEVRSRLSDEAARNGRTLNAEILARVQQSLQAVGISASSERASAYAEAGAANLSQQH
ncbi:MAG: Arc family DNA-binding protein [Burkholderiaceae bacterium]|nr:Arc family DNA-binding protein [Burkholderiaceae bacterium]MDO9089363.1 Arc family DNA-binding protein [Burkholderiaceae bacterium]MDP1968154.1 Arc family DNA-binding protein [Burkholderiaceae bacterium]